MFYRPNITGLGQDVKKIKKIGGLEQCVKRLFDGIGTTGAGFRGIKKYFTFYHIGGKMVSLKGLE